MMMARPKRRKENLDLAWSRQRPEHNDTHTFLQKSRPLVLLLKLCPLDFTTTGCETCQGKQLDKDCSTASNS